MLGLPAPANITKGERTLGMIQFFLFQATIISFEDFIQWGWKKLGGKLEGPSVLRKLVGYCWVVGCFWYSMALAGDVMLRMRLGEESFLPFTILGPCMKYLPIPDE
jgi:hypothetical protein